MTSKAKLRIKGLVSLMNRVRKAWSVGVPESELADFRAMVRDSLRKVEAICRQYDATPEDLPAPSRRAYAYLKGLDLRAVPVRQGPVPPQARSLQITGVVATTHRYHAEFSRLARDVARAWEPTDEDVVALAARLRSDADAIDALCREEGASPAALPVQSRRGYQWLAYLGDAETLALHLKTLAAAYKAGKDKTCRKALTAEERDLALHIEFYATSALYRTRIKRRRIEMVANEGFVGAPWSVIKALVGLALRNKNSAYQNKVKAYAHSEDFEEVLAELALMTADRAPNPQGQHHDLAEAFDRVNAAYFDGAMARPGLTWNRTLTHRKMGHYDFRTDTVMVSITLDHAQVPDYVVDYVMYHELLHKRLGVNVVNGRRYVHTPEFRAEEQKFRELAETKAFLTRWSRT